MTDTRRTPEQVHADGGHDGRPAKSCHLCQQATEGTPPPVVDEPDTASAPVDVEPVGDVVVCVVDGCGRAPTIRGLCGAHWATHRGMAMEGA